MIDINQYSPEIQQKITASRQAGYSDAAIQPYIDRAMQPQQPAVQQQPATPTSQKPSLGGFVGNLASDVGSTVQGLFSIPQLIGQAFSSPEKAGNIASSMVTGTIDEYKKLLTGEGEGGTPLLSHAYAHPLNTVLDVLPIIQAAKGLSAAGRVGKVGQEAGIAEKAGQVAEAATADARFAGKSLAEIGAMQTPEEIAATLGTDVNTLARRTGSVPQTGAIATEKSIADLANTLGTKENTLRSSLAEAFQAEGRPVQTVRGRGISPLATPDEAILKRLAIPQADENPMINEIKKSLNQAHYENATLPKDFGTTLAVQADIGDTASATGKIAQEWARLVKPPLPPVEEAAAGIAQKASQVGKGVKAPSTSARILASRFDLPDSVAQRLTADEVSQELIRYGVKDVNAAAVKADQALNLIGGIYQDAVKRIGVIPDTGAFDVASEAFQSVGGSAAKRELGNASRIIYGIDKPTPATAVAVDELGAVRKLEAEAQNWHVRAVNKTNPDPLAGRISEAYSKTANSMLDTIKKKIDKSGLISEYKTPEVMTAAQKISPELAKDLAGANGSEIRGLMKTWVRAKEMVKYAGSGEMMGPTKRGRYSLPMMAGIGLGAKFGLPGALGGFLAGTVLQPAAEAFTQRALNVMTPATITAIEKLGTPLTISAKVALRTLETPLTVIAGKVAQQGSAAPATDNTAIQKLGMQVGYQPNEIAGPETTYPLENMIKDVSRDPKNASYYKWLYDTLYKENLPTSAKLSHAREQGMINTAISMLPLVDKATGLGPIGGPTQRFLQDVGGGYDPNTLLLFQRMALLKDSVGAELSRRSASKETIASLEDAFPQVNEPAAVWKQKLQGLVPVLQQYFQIFSSEGAGASIGTSGLGDISSAQIGQ